MLGLMRPSSVGPWLEYTAIEVSLSRAPTVITSSADPGVPIWPLTALLPAAMNRATPDLTISLAILLTDSSSAEVHSITPIPPRLMLAALMLKSCLLSTVHSIPAITVANDPDPPASRTLTPTSWACGATPTYSYVGAPVPAVMPAQWVPWPWSSYAFTSVPLVLSGELTAS